MMEAVPTPIVGRDAVVDELVGALGLAGGPPTGAVLLGGDAGIGKTRVVDETVARARAAGALVLLGHCLDLGEHVRAFQPVADALAGLDTGSGADDGVGLGELSASLPALEALRTGQAADDDGDRLRADVLAAVAHALEHLAATSPVLLVLEDLHWADASTRHLVRYLLARRFARPLGLLLTFRSDDLHRRHPLRPALAEWTRLPSARRIDLPPLDDTAVTDLLRARAARGLTPDGVDTILARAEGNAFYAEGAARRRARRRRPARRPRRPAAGPRRPAPRRRPGGGAGGRVRGRSRPRRAAAPRGRDPGVGRRGAARGRDLKVLVPVGDTLRFRHALLAEAVLDDLLPGERRRIHLVPLNGGSSWTAPAPGSSHPQKRCLAATPAPPSDARQVDARLSRPPRPSRSC